jgi:hypothetical protein
VKVTYAMVVRARTVLAAQGPIPSDDVIRRALRAALGPVKQPGRKPGPHKPAANDPGNPGQPRSTRQDYERNKRLIESGETFAGHKPSDFRRR